MGRLISKLSSLLLAVCLLLSLSVPAAWAEGSDEIAISSVKELLDFAEHCALDTWSQGKTVTLTADLDLAGVEFHPIPTFGGTFQGSGHTISGLRITNSGSDQGLFRYIQSGGVVEDLKVSGTVAPGGSRSAVGGIAGVNRGTIRNCSFQGQVEGESAVGGIAGRNEETGEVAGCSASGAVQGRSATGGIAGRNEGVLLKCANSAAVNTSEEETSLSLTDLETGSVLSQASESGEETADTLLNTRSDTGGIVGYSSGLVQSCDNTGPVGYAHVGYNVGGVAGRQTGYLAGCSNSGTVLGRKDVGGIVGQAEPYVALTPGSDSLNRLRRELDALDALVNRAMDHAQGAGDDISDCLSRMGDTTDSLRETSLDLADQTADFIDANLDTLNSVSASITDALDRIAPALDDLADAAGRLERLSGHLEEALEELGGALDLSDGALAKLKRSAEQLKSAAADMRAAAGAMKTAVEELLRAVIGDDGAAADIALSRLKAGMVRLGNDFQTLSEAVEELRSALAEAEDLPGGDAALTALQNLSAALAKAGEALRNAAGGMEEIPAAGLDQISWGTVAEALRPVADNLRTAAGHLRGALDDLRAALKQAGGMSGSLGDALEQLTKAAEDAAYIGDSLESAFRTMGDVASGLAEDGPVEFATLGEDYRAAGESLFDSLGSLSGQMTDLRETVSGAGDLLAEDLRAISGQFNTVTDVLLDALTDLRDGTDKSLDDYIQDTSEEDISATRQGKIAGCRNTGAVEGDRSVGGIVGAMAIEYDLDPEDDITEKLSFGSSYETKAVLQSCVNRGGVAAKKDCVGGIVGRMDLGTAYQCQNYGAVESTGGDYVGGVAGYADASVRGCWSKCTLSGENHIGGIAGWGSRLRDSCAMVSVTAGEECVGAIAGSADLTDGIITGNSFVNTGAAGIDGVSYAGRAEPVSFEELSQRPDVPAEFLSFTLTLTAGGETVASIPFRYGQDLSLLELPEVPEKEGYYGQWPFFDTTGTVSDLQLEAEYHAWITLAASEERSGELSLALAEGQFTQGVSLRVTDSVQTPPESASGARVWEVSLTGTDLTDSDTVPLRLLNEGGGKAAVWQYTDGQWREVEASAHGKYLRLKMTGTSGTFCVVSQADSVLLTMVLLMALLLAAVLAALVIARAVRRRKKNKAARPQETKTP